MIGGGHTVQCPRHLLGMVQFAQYFKERICASVSQVRKLMPGKVLCSNYLRTQLVSAFSGTQH